MVLPAYHHTSHSEEVVEGQTEKRRSRNMKKGHQSDDGQG